MTAIISLCGTVHVSEKGPKRVVLKNDDGLFEVNFPATANHNINLRTGQLIHVAGQLYSYNKRGLTCSYIEPIYINLTGPATDLEQHMKMLLAVSLDYN